MGNFLGGVAFHINESVDLNAFSFDVEANKKINRYQLIIDY